MHVLQKARLKLMYKALEELYKLDKEDTRTKIKIKMKKEQIKLYKEEIGL